MYICVPLTLEINVHCMFTITWNLYFIPLYAIYTPTTLPFHQYTNAIYEHNILSNL